MAGQQVVDVLVEATLSSGRQRLCSLKVLGPNDQDPRNRMSESEHRRHPATAHHRYVYKILIPVFVLTIEWKKPKFARTQSLGRSVRAPAPQYGPAGDRPPGVTRQAPPVSTIVPIGKIFYFFFLWFRFLLNKNCVL